MSKGKRMGWLEQIIAMAPPPPTPIEPPPPPPADGGAGGARSLDNITMPKAPGQGGDGGAGGNGGQQGQVRPFDNTTLRAPGQGGADGGAGGNGGRQGQVRAFDNTTPRAPTVGADGGAGGNGGQVRPFDVTTPRAPAVGADGGAGGNAGNTTPLPEASPSQPFPAERTHSQEQAFEKVYGRKPVTDNDWRMAAALDPHSYDSKYHGVPPEIVAGRITPQPGKGVVRSNMFIPTDQVQNLAKDFTDITSGRLGPKNFGDNRGPSAVADPEASRVSVFVDYDHGLIVVRQNPTSNVDGARGGAAADVPNVHLVQAPDGRITIDYNAHDAYENPLGTAAGISVNGRATLSPHPDGTVGLGGNTTIYPSMETYQYRDGLPPAQLQWNPANSGSALGPGTSLERHHWIGDATIPAVRPDMPGWKWELENANPFAGDPFLSHTTQLTDPFQGGIPSVAVGR
jgi:hypothetical protein